MAIGDSTTEGLEDPTPDGRGYRGFADRLAARLAREQPALLYANLGIRGRKMRQIREEQLEPALALEPDLVSIVGGLNDILRPRIDFHQVVGDLEHMVSAFATRGATVLGVTFPDAARIMPAARPARRRVSAFNLAIREIADRHGMLIADLERHGVVDRPPVVGGPPARQLRPGTRGSPPRWSRRSDSSPTRIHGRRFRRPTRSPAPRQSPPSWCG